MLCDGASCSRALYPDLFDVIGVEFGGDGISNFNVPNLVGRVALGQGAARSGTVYPFAVTGGSTSVTLTQDNLPAHGHSLNASSSPLTNTPGAQVFVASQAPSSNAAAVAYLAATTTGLTALAYGSVGPAGGGQAHANVQPALAVLHCICFDGTKPVQN